MIRELSILDARIPQWNLAESRARDCPICSAKDHVAAYLRPDKLTLRHCQQCHIYFVSPAPSDPQLSAFYAQYDQTHRREADIPREILAESYLRADPLNNMRMQEIASMMDLKGKQCLDIGFGRGCFLAYFKTLGATPYGVELDRKAIADVKRFLRIESVFEGTIFDLDASLRFDVITMNDLIEHPLEPARLFAKAAALLNHSGLVVVVTPNGSSMIGQEEQPIAFRVDLEHMQYLSFESCFFLARRHGLTVVHLESFGFPGIAGIGSLGIKHSGSQALRQAVKNKIKGLLGGKLAKRIQSVFAKESVPERMGCYQLFCIFQKP